MRVSQPCLDLRQDHLAIVSDILHRHVPDRRVIAFGSRATSTAKEYSDLGLAILGEEPLPLGVSSVLAECFMESALPFNVDLVDWASLDSDFRERIRRDGVHVQLPGKRFQQEHAVLCDSGTSAGLTPKQWRRTALREVTDLTLSSVDKKSRTNERSVMLCNYTDAYNNSFIRADMDFMKATATDHEIARCSLAAGDVIITKDSEKHDDIGVPALVREHIEDLVCGYHLAILRPCKSELDGAYLYYALNTEEVQRQFHSYSNGVTRFGLRKADIGLVEIPLPTLSEQRFIAHMLGALDDKIELNRRINGTLEAMARALFKDWFVDFGPVRAKMEGRDTGLPKEIADLFPGRLVDSELGEIPEGWECYELGDLIELAYGKALKSKSRNSTGRVPVFGSNGQIGWHDEALVTGSGIVVGRKGNPGTVTLSPTDFFPIDTTFYVVPKCGIDACVYFLFFALQEQDLPSVAADSAVPGLNRNLAYMNKQLKPPTCFMKCFNECVSAMYAYHSNAAGESRLITSLRDTLLPKLVSGALRAPLCLSDVEMN